MMFSVKQRIKKKSYFTTHLEETFHLSDSFQFFDDRKLIETQNMNSAEAPNQSVNNHGYPMITP